MNHERLKYLQLQPQILKILADPKFQDEATEDVISEEIIAFAETVSWNPIVRVLITILLDVSLMHYWYDVVACLFCCDCHQRDLPCDSNYLIALLYDCLRISPVLGQSGLDQDNVYNLVWSIVHQLKGVGYLADYEPQADPEVIKHQIIR